jgi:hypothetical protein
MLSVVTAGVAFGSALALAAAWARHLRPRDRLPHLGLGGLLGVGSAVTARLADVPGIAVVTVGLAAGAAAGLLAVRLDATARARSSGSGMPCGADIAVLAAMVAAAGLVLARTPSAAPLSVTPAGAGATLAGAVLAVAVAAAGLWLLTSPLARRLPDWRRVALIGACVGGCAAFAAGALPPDGSVLAQPTAGAADAAGLAARVTVAGAVAASIGRKQPVLSAAAAGFGLGILEVAIRAAAA